MVPYGAPVDDSCHSLPTPPPGVQAECSGGNGGSRKEPHCHSGREGWWEGGWRCWSYSPGERESGGGGRGGGFADTLTNQLWIRYPSLSHLLPTPLNHFLLPPSLFHSLFPSLLAPSPLFFPTHSLLLPSPPPQVMLSSWMVYSCWLRRRRWRSQRASLEPVICQCLEQLLLRRNWRRTSRLPIS